MKVEFVEADKLKQKPEDITKVPFGGVFTDYMLEMDYETTKGWHNARIVPYGNIPLSPATSTLHYGQNVFEGIKAFKDNNGEVKIFRLTDHLKRLNRSCEILDIPPINVEQLRIAVLKLLEIEKDWVPMQKGASVYIRPFVFNADEYLNIAIGKTFKFFVILSPVASLYANGFSPIKILVEDKYVRAVNGGLGEAKTAANYAASLHAGIVAQNKGYSQVLWLDGIEHKYIEEVGSMNIFFKINGELVTPALNGSILSGITRQTVLTIAKQWGINTSERKISIEEVIQAHDGGSLEEVFGTGTAAFIAPIGELLYKDKKMTINNFEVGSFARKIFDYMSNMQRGLEEDKFGFFEKV